MRNLLLILAVALASAGIGKAAQAPTPLPAGLVRVISRATPATTQSLVAEALEKIPKENLSGDMKNYLAELRRWSEAPWLGTGLVFDPKGHVLVSSQLVENHRAIAVEIAPGSWLPGRLVGLDRMTDMAVIKMAEYLPAGKLTEYFPKKGETITAAGYPLGRPAMVSGKVLEAEVRRSVTSLERFVITDIELQRGLAGGVLLNKRQEAVGWLPGPDISPPPPPRPQGTTAREPLLAFALPSVRVKKIAQAIAAQGSFRRPYLGLKVIERKDGAGLEVLRVIGAGPADRAGLQGGDILLRLGGQPIPDGGWLRRQISEHRAGDSLVFTVQRQDEILDKTMILSYFGREDELRL